MFKQRKHKRFNYKPKYSSQSNVHSKDDIETGRHEFATKWQRQRDSAVHKRKRAFSMSALIIILVLLLIGIYLLDWKFM